MQDCVEQVLTSSVKSKGVESRTTPSQQSCANRGKCGLCGLFSLHSPTVQIMAARWCGETNIF